MNRSKIEYCDHTWNPITGCRYGCTYCFAKSMVKRFSGDIRLNKMAKADYALDGDGLYVLDKPMINETGSALVYPFGFEPTLYKYRASSLDNLKMGNNIYVGAMAEMFGEWIPDSWLDIVFQEIEKRPQHNYLFLTKNPKRYGEYGVPAMKNAWYGTTITKKEEMYHIGELPSGCNTYVSLEPIFEDIDLDDTALNGIGWIIIGAEKGRRREKVVPEFEWIRKIVLAADNKGIPIFMKESLTEVVGKKNMRRDFPQELLKRKLSEKMKNKLYDKCNMCGKYEKKVNMVTIMGRKKRRGPVVQFAFVCCDCIKMLCDGFGVDVPNFDRKEE